MLRRIRNCRRSAAACIFLLALLCSPGILLSQTNNSGAQWTLLTPAGSPPDARSQNAAVFDSIAGNLILFNDGCGSTCDFNDVWSLSFGANSQWTQTTSYSEETIPARTGASATYDSSTSTMTVFGGGEGSSSPCENDTWAYFINEGDDDSYSFWYQLDTSGGPPAARIFHTAVYDPNSNSMIVFGGNNCLTQGAVYYNDTWVLSNANDSEDETPTWTQLTFTGSVPPERENHTAVYDPDSNTMIVFGGANSNGLLNDVWILSNANGASGTPTWTQVTPTGTPPAARSGAGAVYDATLNRMIVFGGNNGDTYFNDVWILTNANGTGGAMTWIQLQPSGTLSAARSEFAATLNSMTDQLVIFGGGTASSGPLDDTWALSLQPGAAASTSATGGTPQSTMVGTAFAQPLQVTVVDATNNPVPGVTVTFSAPASGATATLSSATAVTDNGGVASVTATANSIAGAYNVTASAAGVVASTNFALTNSAGAAMTIAVTGGTPQAAGIGTTFALPLQATVSDIDGNPVAGTHVTFSVSASGASAALSSATAVTNNTGLASVNATANNLVGTYNVIASVSGVANQAVFALTNTASIVGIVTASLPTGAVGSAYTATFSATGGLAPYSWAIPASSLPAGLTLNATSGVLSGTPSASGTFSFPVTVADSSGQSAMRQLSVTFHPLLSLSLPTGTQQPGATVSTGQVQSAQPVLTALSGTISLSFNGNAAGLPNPYANPGVCFSASSCANTPVTSSSFTIAAGSTSTPIPPLQTGTVAGDIVLSLNVAGQPTSTSTVTVPRTVPAIEANSVQILDVTSTGFVVELVANSSPRDIQSVTFIFTAASGAQLNGNTTFTVDISSLLSAWYASSEGQSYGSAFSLQVPFTLSGDASAIQSVAVTLMNSTGTSAPVTGTQ